MRARHLVLAVGIAVGIAAPAAAQASIQELIINTINDAKVGSIIFPALTGSTDAGVALSYDGFTQADITSISWTIDPSTFDITALHLNALTGDTTCPNDDLACSNNTLNLSPNFAFTGGSFCPGGAGQTCDGSIESHPIAIVPVPEPSTWVLSMLGLLGLGWLRRPRNLSPFTRREAAV
jgi:PEP-CTERM motif